MKPIHPGRILKREIKTRKLSANKLALALRVPSGRITQILNGKRGVSVETALRLSRYFGNSAQFWMNLAIQVFWKQRSVLDEPSSQIRTGSR